MAVSTTPSKWTTEELEDLIVELLADELSTDAASLRRDLEEKGDAMPVDSLQVFNILVEFLTRTGLRVPKKVPPGTMRSVKRFARFAAENAEAK